MIEKLDLKSNLRNLPNSETRFACVALKINEIIDWIDDVSALHITDKQVTANLPNIDAGELAFLSKENSELKDEVDLLQKQLEIAVDALKYIRRTNPISFHFEAIEKALEQITALEQKDVK